MNYSALVDAIKDEQAHIAEFETRPNRTGIRPSQDRRIGGAGCQTGIRSAQVDIPGGATGRDQKTLSRRRFATGFRATISKLSLTGPPAWRAGLP